MSTWINYILLGLSFFLIGASSFLLYRSVYRPSSGVSFRSPQENKTDEQDDTSRTPELPSMSRTVSILKNKDFGLAPREREGDSDGAKEKKTSCSAETYVKRILHVHQNQGIHIQFQSGKTKYLLQDQFYDIPQEKQDTNEESKQNEIAFKGTQKGLVTVQIKTVNNSGESTCEDRLPINMAPSTNISPDNRQPSGGGDNQGQNDQ